jgi:hypothetical protein
MAGGLTSSLSVLFADDSNTAFGIVLERSNREPVAEDEVYFRVHGGDGYTLSCSSGTVSPADSGLSRFTSEFVYFENERFSDLTYPGAVGATHRIIGNPVDMVGNAVYPDLYYDASKNAIASDISFYGVVLVEYQAPFDLWRARFSGVCPSIESYSAATVVLEDGGSPDDDLVYEGRDPMVVYARKDGIVRASLPLDPPPCIIDEESNSFFYMYNEQVELPKLLIEVSSNYPMRLINDGRLRPEAGCRIYVYPDEGDILVNVSSGELGMRRTGQARRVKQLLTFSGTSTQNLIYPPQNTTISVKIISPFIDRWGRSFLPEFKKWGDTIVSVERSGKRTIVSSGSRAIQRTEIAVADMFGNSIDCYGAVEVEYVTGFTSYEYRMDFDFKSRSFVNAFAVASRGPQTASLALNGPRSRTDYSV